tara:strand:+ start:7390 stop:8070 length:681 start_codon:yes stop_codon:yes gene_type:complete
MSMVVMRRKIQAKQMLSKKNAEKGTFALAYTNTGKHLMGRTASKYNGTASSLNDSAKYRRLYCCDGITATTKKPCMGNTMGIKKVPILQMSYRNRIKRLTRFASARPCIDKCRDLSSNSLWKLSPEQYASSFTERIAAANIAAADISCNYFTKNNDNTNKTWAQIDRSQNSLTSGRYQSCLIQMTKDIKKSTSASDHIKNKKSATLNASCIRRITPFSTKNCTPSA